MSAAGLIVLAAALSFGRHAGPCGSTTDCRDSGRAEPSPRPEAGDAGAFALVLARGAHLRAGIDVAALERAFPPVWPGFADIAADSGHGVLRYEMKGGGTVAFPVTYHAGTWRLAGGREARVALPGSPGGTEVSFPIRDE